MSDSLPATASRAVFLSYASEDAQVVRCIAHALRAAGVEVWFDQNELTGGDAWDRKIRGQIKSCRLFVPVISAATQARTEGYFRREWKLAVERTHDIADHVPFLVPVAIDGTTDREAHVPDKFRDVQWTRLPKGETSAVFCAKVRQLLDGYPPEPTPSTPPFAYAGATLPVVKSSARRWLIPAITSAIIIVAIGIWRPWKNPGTAAAMQAPASAPRSAAQPMLDRIWAIYEKAGDSNIEDWALAMDLGAQAVAMDNLNSEAWAAYAQATAWAYIAGFRMDAGLYAQALTRAQRATGLSADSYEARFALASIYALKDATTPEGERLLRQLAAERPTDGRVMRRLSELLNSRGQFQDALVIIDRALALSTRDAVAWYQRALILHRLGKITEAQEAVEKSLAIRVGPRALMEKAYILVFLTDDYPAAAAVIEQLPGSVLTREVETLAYGIFWLDNRQPEKALASFMAFTGDSLLGEPKAYYTGAALAMLGRNEAAQVEWRAALKSVETKLTAKSNDADSLLWKALLLACLGERRDGARTLELARQFAPPVEIRVPKTLAILGQHEAAISDLIDRWAKIKDFHSAMDLRTAVLHDPDFDSLRNDPRFQAFAQTIRDDPRFPIPRKPAATAAKQAPL